MKKIMNTNIIKEIKKWFVKNSKYLFPFFILITFYLFYKIIFDFNFHFYFKSIIFDFFMVSLFFLFFLGLFKKSNIASLVTSIMFSVFICASCIKIYYSNEPILYSDFKYLSDIFEITGIVDNSLFFVSITVALPSIAYIGINTFYLIKAFKNRFYVNNIFLRIIFIFLPICFFTIILTPSSSLKHFALQKIYNLEKNNDDSALASNISHYGRYGIFSGMYIHYLENQLDIPEEYNDSKLDAALSNTSINTDNKFKNSNIIVVFEESFWDIEKVNNEVSFNVNITENYNRLKNEGISFEMISPTYGGISGNVEFEFLTGANLSYFGNGYVPYMQLYTNKNYYNAPSIIHELKNNNYYTKIVTYTGPRLFNCSKFYKYAGFDTTEYNYEVKELNKYIDKSFKKGPNVSDKHIVDEIIKEFNHKEKNKREFYMVLTMQTHSPYTIDKYDNYDISIKKSNFSKSMNEAILSYAQGIYDADQQLARLYDYIQTLDEPTIIVYYGDHLPHFTDNLGKSLLDKFEYFNTDNNLLNIYRKYNTESLILANYEIKESKYKYVSPDLLSTYFLNNMNLNLSDYYKWLYTNMDTIPSLNKYVLNDKNGNIFNVNNLPKNIYNNYNLRNQIQYKFFIKDKYK